MLVRGETWRNLLAKEIEMRKFLTIVAATLMLALPVQADDNGRAQLTVTGQGVAEVIPDMAWITLGVSAEAPDAGDTMDKVAAVTGDMLTLLAQEGVEPRDVQSSQINLSPRYNYNRNNDGPPKLVGFLARATLTVRVLELEKLGQVMTAVTGVGANEIHGLRFDIQDRSGAQDDARKAAVADAKHRAEVLAGAAGLSLGPVILMSEGGSTNIAPVMNAMAMERASADMPIAAGELEIRSSVTMVFQLQDN